MVRLITGSSGREIFDCRTLEEQRDYLATRFPHSRWHLALSLLGNASVFNALLYKGSFPKKNTVGSRFSFYRDAYARLFSISPARENFFLQLSFLGTLQYEEGNPIECDAGVFAKAKSALQNARVDYIHGDVLEVARGLKESVSYLSFSDVPSYFSGEVEKTFLQRIRPGLQKDALVVVRNYLHIPEGADLSGYINLKGRYRLPISREKVQVYDVDVFQHQPTGSGLS